MMFFLFIYCQNWMAFTYLHKPPFSEHNSVYFMNSRPPVGNQNNAYCKVSTYAYSKKVALIDGHLVLGVWSFITLGAFWGKTIAWRRCVCGGRCESHYARPYSQDLSWRVTWFVWNLGLSLEEAAFYRE